MKKSNAERLKDLEARVLRDEGGFMEIEYIRPGESPELFAIKRIPITQGRYIVRTAIPRPDKSGEGV